MTCGDGRASSPAIVAPTAAPNPVPVPNPVPSLKKAATRLYTGAKFWHAGHHRE